jgi:hypothetical protein
MKRARRYRTDHDVLKYQDTHEVDKTSETLAVQAWSIRDGSQADRLLRDYGARQSLRQAVPLECANCGSQVPVPAKLCSSCSARCRSDGSVSLDGSSRENAGARVACAVSGCGFLVGFQCRSCGQNFCGTHVEYLGIGQNSGDVKGVAARCPSCLAAWRARRNRFLASLGQAIGPGAITGALVGAGLGEAWTGLLLGSAANGVMWLLTARFRRSRS